jgi:multidrug efflux pump subunit AcrA (membrane-fusion protein)
MFVRSIIIPTLAVAGVCLAAYTVMKQNKPIIPAQPVAQPASPPYADRVAGAGLVEASTQNIAIGTQISGVVSKVHVKAGDRVKAGDPLFTIDERQQSAELAVREAALRSAQQSLAKLKALPRVEDVPPAEARVVEMKAMVDDMKEQLRIMEAIEDPRAVSKDDLSKRRFAVPTMEARLTEAEANLQLLKAGAWAPDIAIAQAAIDSAAAQVQQVRTELERLTVRAPVSGTVLQCNVRPGEFAQAGSLSTPLILFGNCDILHVRVDIDENDAWRLKTGSAATAYVRGNSEISTPLTFVRLEPYVVPKKSLTGESTERVDTRVLQVLYAFDPKGLPVYVGQQMDVYIDAPRAEKKDRPSAG